MRTRTHTHTHAHTYTRTHKHTQHLFLSHNLSKHFPLKSLPVKKKYEEEIGAKWQKMKNVRAQTIARLLEISDVTIVEKFEDFSKKNKFKNIHKHIIRVQVQQILLLMRSVHYAYQLVWWWHWLINWGGYFKNYKKVYVISLVLNCYRFKVFLLSSC